MHQDLFEMAAAYLFYIAQNPAFLDGNKRTALAAALTFLWMNDIELNSTEDKLTELDLGVASGQTSKAEIAVFFKNHSQPAASPSNAESVFHWVQCESP